MCQWLGLGFFLYTFEESRIKIMNVNLQKYAAFEQKTKCRI